MKKAILFFGACLISSSVFSQGFETIVFASDDANKLAKNYVNPFVKGFMTDLNAGWYTTAKTHNKFGFDLTINPSVAFVPTADEFFDFNPNDYKHLSLPNGETSLPTLMGNSEQQTMVRVSIPYDNQTYQVAEFEMPKGIGGDLPFNAVPLPMVQVGIGLPTRTDLKLRLLPNINIADEAKVNLFGLGLQHDIGQYLKLSYTPLNLSVLAAYTSLDISHKMEDEQNLQNISFENAEASFETTAWTLQALASLDFKFVTLYGALGYNHGKTDVRMKGDYTMLYEVEDQNGNIISTFTEEIKDPINLNFKENGMNGTLGVRLNLSFFKIFASYTLQNYNTATAGIAFSFN